jgi:hypothetical protein
MLALSLSLFLIMAAFKLLSLAKAEMHYQLAKNELMQNLLIVEYELREAVGSSGVASCGQVGSLLSFKNLAKDAAGRVWFSQGTSVQIFNIDQVQGLGLDKAGSGQAIENTDVLMVRGLTQEARLDQVVVKNAQSLSLPKGFKIKAGRVLVVSDCQHLLSDKVIEVSRNHIELESPLGFGFKKGSFVGKFEFEAYYIGKTLRKDANGKLIKALYMQDSQGVRHELVPDVTGLKLNALPHAIEADVKVENEGADLSKESSVMLSYP